MGRILSPTSNSPDHDLVETPKELAQTIVSHFKPTGYLLDPACGLNAPFYHALCKENYVIDWCEISLGRDFFSWTTPVDWIITNPPWSNMRNFIRHGFKVAREVVYLSTLTHFVTRARLADMKEAGFGLREALLCPQPDSPWPSSGFQLAAVWLSKDWAGPLTISSHLIKDNFLSDSSISDLGL